MEPLKIKFSLNLSGHIENKNHENLNLSTEFKYKNKYIVKVVFDLDEKIHEYTSNKIKLYYKSLKKINFEIKNSNKSSYAEILAKTKNKSELYKILLNIINYVLSHIRNDGFTPYLDKIPVHKDKFLYHLHEWNTKISLKKGTWIELVKYHQDFLVETLINSTSFKPITIKADKWPYIEKALKYSLPILFQYELIVNTYEFTWNNNYRIAYVECINALEVALSEYTKIFYNNSNLYKDLSTKTKKRIESNLNGPELSLFTKVLTILFLTCKTELKYVKIEKILKAIIIRNDIIHQKSLKIPTEAEENSEIILHVLILIFLLTNKIQQLSLTGKLLNISKTINEKVKDFKLVIFRRGKVYIAEILYFFPENLKKNKALNKFLDYLEFEIKKIEPDFNINNDLVLMIKGLFNEIYVLWEHGQLKFY